MSYHRYHRHPKSLARRTPQPMGGLLDLFTSLFVGGSAFGVMWQAVKGSATVDQKACLDKANASPVVQQIDAATENLSKTWNIAGRITVTDMTNMAGWVASQNIPAQLALVGAPRATGDAQTVIAMAMDALARNNERIKTWNAAIANAKATGVRVIDAPTFKKDVLNALINISQAYVTRAVMDCNVTWLDQAGQAVQDGVNRALRIADAVLDLAEKTVKAAGAPLDLIAWLGKYGPWAAVGLGGLYIYSRRHK